MNITLINIAVAEAKHAIKQGDTLEQQLKAAMNVTRDHWLVADESSQLNGAVAAVMTFHGPDSLEYERLRKEMRNLNQLNASLVAALQGVPVNWEAIEVEKDYEPIGILKLWREEK